MLHGYLNQLFRRGRLTVNLENGRSFTIGEAEPGSQPLVVRLKGKLTPFKLAWNADRHLGEAYMDGDLVMEQGSIYDLLNLAMVNFELRPTRPPGLLRTAAYKLSALIHQINTQTRSRRNVSHHYDLSHDLYRLFLDDDLQYSCAYFADPDMTLDEAQAAKKRHIVAKLLVAPGQRVLDIGCGWGGLALSIARAADVQVLGITLSREQLAVARQRAEALGLSHRVRFELRDYRTLDERFDRIVSVGMFEHVGTPHYDTYFGAIRRLLAPDGVALIHSIGRNTGRTATSAWIRKHIFPGGHIPALSEVVPPIEASGLWLTDLEVLRLHYAETLRHWRARYMARRGALRPRYDARFERMWEFYLAASEASFRHGGLMVFQAQLSPSIDAVPLTRDYIGVSERDRPDERIRAAE